MTEFKIHDDAEAVAAAAAEYLFSRISTRVMAKGVCHVVLPGGTTPGRCLELLADKPLPWDRIHWYLSDERCLPRGDDARNDTMVYRALFSRPDSVVENFHPIPAEMGAEQAADEYASLIDEIGTIDIVVLGMGEDGHTASLFPGNAALDKTSSVVAVHDAPKPPPDRVSLGLQTLMYAGECILLATGKGKREAIAKLQYGEAIPATLVEAGICFVDKAALGNRP